jgi:HTH-type transcriptional regulator / antitoxin HipB
MRYSIQLPSQLSSHIRALRKTKGLSQADLGLRLGLSQARIARIEGDPLSISTEQLLAVLAALGVQIVLEPLPSSQSSAKQPATDEAGW